MTITIYDRVQETTTTAGTDSITLLGAVAGFQTFNDTVGVSNQTYYGIVDSTANIWEIGIGTLTDSTTLSRDTVISSTSSGSLITLLGNSANVFIDVPASKRIQIDSTVIGTAEESIFYGDGSHLTGVGSASLPLQTSSDPQSIMENAASEVIFQTDSSGNPQLLNSLGSHVFAIDGSGNPQLISGNLPGFDGSLVAFDGNNNPIIVNSTGISVYKIDTSGNPVISNNNNHLSIGIDSNHNPYMYSDQEVGGYAFDENNNPIIINRTGSRTIGFDSSGNTQIGNGFGNQVFGIDGNYNPKINPVSGNATIGFDSGNNPYIVNVNGGHIFSCDSNNNPQLTPNSFGFDDVAIIGFDSNGNPQILGGTGSQAFGVDLDTFRPVINGSVWPANAVGNISNDGDGNLSISSPYRTINTQTTDYTLLISDAGQMVILSSSGAITLTVPAGVFSNNVEIDVVQGGVGQVTIAGADGVTINSYLSQLSLSGQWAGGSIKQISSNNWLLIGNLS